MMRNPLGWCTCAAGPPQLCVVTNGKQDVKGMLVMKLHAHQDNMNKGKQLDLRATSCSACQQHWYHNLPEQRMKGSADNGKVTCVLWPFLLSLVAATAPPALRCPTRLGSAINPKNRRTAAEGPDPVRAGGHAGYEIAPFIPSLAAAAALLHGCALRCLHRASGEGGHDSTIAPQGRSAACGKRADRQRENGSSSCQAFAPEPSIEPYMQAGREGSSEGQGSQGSAGMQGRDSCCSGIASPSPGPVPCRAGSGAAGGEGRGGFEPCAALNTVRHHDMHHRFPTRHFALYFTHWDRWCGTEHPAYRSQVRFLLPPDPALCAAAGCADNAWNKPSFLRIASRTPYWHGMVPSRAAHWPGSSRLPRCLQRCAPTSCGLLHDVFARHMYSFQMCSGTR